MKVTVDARCSGHARCAAAAPEFWELDDLGYNALVGNGAVEIPVQSEQLALSGAEVCPERAITIED